MLANQHDTETQNCQLTAPHHMANEKGGGKDEVIPIPLKTKASSHIAAPLLRLIPLRVRMSDTAQTQPWRPPGRGSGRVMSPGGGGGGWREAEPPAPKPKCSAPAKQCGAPRIILIGKIPRETRRVVPIKNYKTFRAEHHI